MKVKSVSCVRLFATPWTAVYQAPPSMGFSRQEYWSRLPLMDAKSITVCFSSALLTNTPVTQNMIGTKGRLSHYNLYVCVLVAGCTGSPCCSTWDLQLWRVGSSPLIRDPSLAPYIGSNRVLATRPLGKSQPHYNLYQRKK